MRHSTDRSLIMPVTEWQVAATEPDSVTTPDQLDELDWLPARVPGTVAGALRDAMRWTDNTSLDLDASDWWFRSRLDAEPAEGAEVVLRLGGIATLAEVFLDRRLVLTSESMFAAHEIDLSNDPWRGTEIAVRCRALSRPPATTSLPRARWRPRIAGSWLRHQRTMLLGRAPGFAPGPAAVGPWRGVDICAHSDIVVDDLRVRATVSDDVGYLAVASTMRGLGAVEIQSIVAQVSGPTGMHSLVLPRTSDQERTRVAGDVPVPNVVRWWPHTHGAPVLYDVQLQVVTTAGTVTVDAGRVGFREIEPGPPHHEIVTDGLALRVNAVPVFVRGAVWTPLDLVGLSPDEGTLRSTLCRVRDAGMNMLRLAGTGAYESPRFHDLCDELGILIWQDFMFANFDYPSSDATFRDLVEVEARSVLANLASRPSLAVLCGNSEVEQQAAMLGVAAETARAGLFGETLPRLIREAGLSTIYVPSTPCGGDQPFRPDVGIANYYGVGGYRRALSDARLAGVRFAAECLALANVPDGGDLIEVGVPRDVGADWDFGDVRDHYVAELYGVDVAALRRQNPEHFLELSRAASGEVMAAVFGEWRRSASLCGGGLVHWLTDLAPGSGWGVLDNAGRPKVAYHHLRRALAPVAVWLTDEGLAGLDVHVANDRPDVFRAHLRVSFYRDGQTLVEEARSQVTLAPHTVERYGVEELLGRFVDASYAYRFGPPGSDLVVATLEDTTDASYALISQAVHFPAGRPASTSSADHLGLAATWRLDGDQILVTVRGQRFAHGVRLLVEGYEPDDDAFPLEPGRSRTVRLNPAPGQRPQDVLGQVSAVNLAGQVDITPELLR